MISTVIPARVKWVESYADPRTMPIIPMTVQVISSDEVGKVGIVE